MQFSENIQQAFLQQNAPKQQQYQQYIQQNPGLNTLPLNQPQPVAMQIIGTQQQQQPSDCKIFIGDIDDSMQESTLRRIFDPFGSISTAKVIKAKSKTFGEICFNNQDSVPKAIYSMNLALPPGASKPIRVMKYSQLKVKQKSDSNVFIKNISPSINLQELWHTLLNFGNISSIKVGTTNSGQIIGYCYIQFENKEDAENCIQNIGEIKLQQQLSPLVADLYLEKENRVEFRTNLYLKNLPDQFTEDELKSKIHEIFEPIGEIASSMVKKATIKGSLKPFAFICFKNTESAEKAMEQCKDQDVFGCNQPLYMNWAETRTERLKKLKEQQSQGSEKILYTKNLKLDVTAEILINAYSEIGEIEYCNVKEPNFQNNSQFKRTKFGYIFFKDKEYAKKAIIEAKDNNQILGLYEDSKLYINNLLNKETYQRYKSTYKNKKQQLQEDNKQNSMNQQMPFFQIMQFFSQFLQTAQQSGFMQQNQQKPNQFNRPPYRQNNQMPGAEPQFRQEQKFNQPRQYQSQYNPKRQQQFTGSMSNQMPQNFKSQPPMARQMPQQQQQFQQRIPQQQMPPQMLPQMPPYMSPSQMPPQMQSQPLSQPNFPPQQIIPQIPQQQQMLQQPAFSQQQQFLQQQQQQQKFMQMQPPQIPQQQTSQLMQPRPPMPIPIPQQPQQQQPQPQQQQYSSQFKSVNQLKTELNQFLELSQDEQRKILGEMLYPKILAEVNDPVLAPKITGMLIDFEVFEVQDILEFLENQNQLQEQIKEAQELINTQSQS